MPAAGGRRRCLRLTHTAGCVEPEGWQIDQVDRRSAGKGRTGTNAVERQQRPGRRLIIFTVYRGVVIFRAGKLQNRPLDRLGLGVDLGPRRLGTGFGDADARPSAWASSAPPEASPMTPQLDIHWCAPIHSQIAGGLFRPPCARIHAHLRAASLTTVPDQRGCQHIADATAAEEYFYPPQMLALGSVTAFGCGLQCSNSPTRHTASWKF